jgi:hypothetical protein
VRLHGDVHDVHLFRIADTGNRYPHVNRCATVCDALWRFPRQSGHHPRGPPLDPLHLCIPLWLRGACLPINLCSRTQLRRASERSRRRYLPASWMG